MAGFKHFEECPKCHIPGRNMTFARYDDGSAYCFFCGLPQYSAQSRINSIKSLGKEDKPIKRNGYYHLPNDYVGFLPSIANDWLNKYQFTIKDIPRIGWCNDKQAVYLPLLDQLENGKVIYYQYRNFADKGAKYYTDKGVKPLYVPQWIGREHRTPMPKVVVLVEDLLSSIRIQQAGYAAMWCMGTNIPIAATLRGLESFQKRFVWLDRDASEKSLKTALCSSALKLTTVLSNHDPKCYSVQAVREIIGVSPY